MTPFETFEQECQKHHEEFRKNVEKINQRFHRDVKRTFLILGAVAVLNIAVWGVILWLLEGAGK